MEELGRYSKEYKKRLDEVGALGEIPEDLAVEVLSGCCSSVLLNQVSIHLMFDPYNYV